MTNKFFIIGVISAIAVMSGVVFATTLEYENSSSQNTEFKVLFGGDFSFGENYQDRLKEKGQVSILEEKGYDYSIENFKDVLLESDFVVLNLETVITDLSESPLEGEKSYIHYSNPQITPVYLKKYNIDAVSLANNHSFDYGNEGLVQTIDILDANNIERFGAGRNSSDASRPLFKTFEVGKTSFKLMVIGAYEYSKNYDKKYEFYANETKAGVRPLDVDGIISQIESAKALDPEIFVIVYPHWGKNYSWKSEKQTEIARKLIDSGADLIIGHGAHKIQEIEFYNEKWIVYNLGNFMFNSPGRYEDHSDEPYSFIAVFSKNENSGENSMKLKLYPIFSDNKLTDYQPRFLLEEEFEDMKKIFEDKNFGKRDLMEFGVDEFGHYVELQMIK